MKAENKKRKILFYTPVALTSGGGCERWHCDITNSLEEQFGDNVEIVSGNHGEKRWSEEYLKQQLHGIVYKQLNYPIFLGVLIPTPFIVFFLLKKFRQADVVYFINGFMGQDILMVFLKLITGKKIVAGYHAPIFYASKIHNLYMRFVSRYLMNFFDYQQTLNNTDKIFLEKKWGIRNVHFIPIGIHVEKFIKTKKIKHRGLTFISVGRYVLQKGFDLQLQAIEVFNKRHKNNQVLFYFIGSGSLKSLIQRYAKKYKNIIDVGYVDYDNIRNYYAKSDVYLLTSREEPFGLVLIEAWGLGLPVLGTKTEGPRDMLEENRNGWFIPRVTAEDIYNSIAILYKKYMKNQTYFVQFEKKCRETSKLFSIDLTAQKMKKAFFD